MDLVRTYCVRLMPSMNSMGESRTMAAPFLYRTLAAYDEAVATTADR